MQIYTIFIIIESSLLLKNKDKKSFDDCLKILMKADNFLQKSKTSVVTPHL